MAGADFHGHRPAVFSRRLLSWDLMSGNSGALTRRLVHPTAPVLLTKSGPLGTRIRVRASCNLPLHQYVCTLFCSFTSIYFLLRFSDARDHLDTAGLPSARPVAQNTLLTLHVNLSSHALSCKEYHFCHRQSFFGHARLRTHSKFESRSRSRRPGLLQSVALPDETPFPMSTSYPEGNFGGNQLLDGSFGLSPLYPAPTIDLHVRTASDLHRVFPGFVLARHRSPSFGSRRVRSGCVHGPRLSGVSFARPGDAPAFFLRPGSVWFSPGGSGQPPSVGVASRQRRYMKWIDSFLLPASRISPRPAL